MNRTVVNTVLAVAIAGANCALTACMPTGPKPNYSSAPATAVGVPSLPANTTSASAAGPVPVDQIPPGNPASWVPAGVPTTGPYVEPGETVPKFTREMFTESKAGARAAALYYLAARNWNLATLSPISFMAVCDAQKCKDDVLAYEAMRRKGQHIRGARASATSIRVTAVGADKGNGWVASAALTLSPGQLINPDGGTADTQAPSRETDEIFLSWSGTMWRVTDIFLARS